MIVPLEGYALIGDCQTAALISQAGFIFLPQGRY
jgi:hypothetical protein